MIEVLLGGSSFDLESFMPRWRRPSLIQARKADPSRSVGIATTMSFGDGSTAIADGRERRVIRYRLVRLLDAAPDLRGTAALYADGDDAERFTVD